MVAKAMTAAMMAETAMIDLPGDHPGGSRT